MVRDGVCRGQKNAGLFSTRMLETCVNLLLPCRHPPRRLGVLIPNALPEEISCLGMRGARKRQVGSKWGEFKVSPRFDGQRPEYTCFRSQSQANLTKSFLGEMGGNPCLVSRSQGGMFGC